MTKEILYKDYFNSSIFDPEGWSGFDLTALYFYIYGKSATYEAKSNYLISINKVFRPSKMDSYLQKYELFLRVQYNKFNKYLVIDRESESIIAYNGSDNIAVLTNNQNFIEKVKLEIDSFCKTYRSKEGATVKLIYRSGSSYSTSEFTLPKIKLDISENYNDDLPEIHEKILEFLKLKRNDGHGRLVVLHGEPGTGKTSYLKWIIQKYRIDNIIFITPEILVSFASTEFTSFLTRYRDSIFIVEDAEKVIVSRDDNIISPVSHILQLTDGFLGDAFNLRLIMSFNKEIESVDSALLRKGRMRLQYRFDKLSIEKSQKKLNSLGVEKRINEEMTLAEIYNISWDNGNKEKPKKEMGFNYGN